MARSLTIGELLAGLRLAFPHIAPRTSPSALATLPQLVSPLDLPVSASSADPFRPAGP